MDLGNPCVAMATTRSCGLCPSASCFGATPSGTKWTLRYRSARLHSFPGTSSWRLQLQDSFAPQRPQPIVAAKQPENRGKNSKTASSAGEPDDNKSTETSLNEGLPVEDEASKKISDTPVAPATREEVLKACVNTSAALAAAAIVIRQGTHWAAEANWSIPDCYIGMTSARLSQSVPLPVSLQAFPWATWTHADSFEVWHLGATAGTVALIASLRQILLSTWPEFSRSSRQSNKQVLSSLKLNDYLVVSFLPGISEELLFRGTILPLIGVDWRGVAVSGFVFGILHISGGRNAAFAAWASFVGVVYGLAAITTHDLAVPMVAHSVANLIAAYVWRIEENGNTKE